MNDANQPSTCTPDNSDIPDWVIEHARTAPVPPPETLRRIGRLLFTMGTPADAQSDEPTGDCQPTVI